jgi:hypothetical protein
MVPASHERPEAPLFSDGIGDRVVAADPATGELLQILRLRPELTAVPSFEFALRERSARLANFRHAYYGRVRRIDRVSAPVAGLAVVSDHVEGTRLSDLLRVAHERHLQLDINAALYLIRQLVPAVALLHENARDVAHGLLAPERMIVTPHARLVIVEHVLGSAMEQLQLGRERLWQEFRIALPQSAGRSRFDHRGDVVGVGLVALALVLGRPLRSDDFPAQIPALLDQARERSALGEEQPLSPGFRAWLARALQVDVRRAFGTAPEALSALDEVVAEASTYVAAPVALETFMTRYIAALLEPQPAPAPMAPDPIQSFAPAPPPAPPSVHHSFYDDSPAAPAAHHSFYDEQPPATAAPSYSAPSASTPSHSAPSYSAPSYSEPFEPAAASFEPPPAAAPAPRASVPDYAAFTPARPEPAISAPDITTLIPPAELGLPEAAPLFNPDRPFVLAEEPTPAPASAETAPKRNLMRIAAMLVAVLALAGGGVYATRYMGGGSSSAVPEMGTLVVQSNPAGVQVVVDGVDRGMTPARVSLPPGAHILELRGRGVPRVIPINVTAGAQVSQYLEFADTPVTGLLQVQSQPAGARVIVDGTDRGATPLTVNDLTPGDHEVILRAGETTAKHTVTIQAGVTSSLVVPIGAAVTEGPVSGWLTVKAPFALEVREGGRQIGTTDTDRIMLAAGRHELELVNDTLAYRANRTVNIVPGKVASISVDLPQGVVNLNASPWAEVWIDGQRVGETPIGNLSVPIGQHEVVFRHPQLGEKRHAISVTLAGPVRLSVEMK